MDSYSTETSLFTVNPDGTCPVCGGAIVNSSGEELIIKSRLARITADGVSQKCKQCGNFVNISTLVKAFILFKLFDKTVKVGNFIKENESLTLL